MCRQHTSQPKSAWQSSVWRLPPAKVDCLRFNSRRTKHGMSNWVETVTHSETSTYCLSAWLFLRVLGFIYLAAFASLLVQIKGLAGQNGILPAAAFLKSRKHKGRGRFFRHPTLCWMNASDGFLLFLCWCGAVMALMLVIDLAPLLILILLWALYLSLFKACRLFLSYQWDVLLLETGFLAIFLAPMEILPRFPPTTAPPQAIVWVFWWLLFRLMFSSGVVKLRSGDKPWRNLTALCYHYQTQPLPTPPAWYLYQFPRSFHKISALVMFAIELGGPFLILLPPPFRYVAAGLFVTLMLLIQLTGNYCFFNLLGIALSVLLIDDRALLSVLDHVLPEGSLPGHFAPAPHLLVLFGSLVALLVLVLSVEPVSRLSRYAINWPKPLAALLEFLAPFHLVSGYGLFAVMTIERPEIIIEGSDDGVQWLAYEFKWKPGDVRRGPRFVAPHQPRLDWQMWFAALGTYENNPWFLPFLIRLLEGSSPVLSLLKGNPFPEHPPRYVRAVMYDYRFSSRGHDKVSGTWWQRERRGVYCPQVELSDTVSDHV